MLGYAVRRLLLALPLLLGITFVSFTVIHLAPGEPAEIQTGDLSIQSDAQARQLLREMYDLDKPLHVQYGKWLARLGRLDFGKSFSPDGRPVLQKIGERLPVTLLLNIIEMLIIVALAVPIGVLSATRQYSLFDKVTTVFVFLGFAIPGMGQLMVQAVFERDYPVIMGNLVIVSTLTLVANLVADVTYSFVDPRIRVGARRGRR